MGGLLHDLHHSLRVFARRPGFALLVVLTLALGIGVTTAIYSLTSAVVLRPLPFHDAERLVAVYETNLPRIQFFAVAPANFLDWQAQNRVFTAMAAIEGASMSLSGSGEPAALIGRRVSTSFFDILGTRPLLGRVLLPEDDSPSAEPVVVLSYGLWRRQFGGDSGMVGRTVTLNRTSHTVVGVLPPSGRFYTSPWDPQEVQIWLPNPFAADPREERRAKRLSVIARLAPGVSLEWARNEMQVIARRLQETYPETNTGWSVGLRPLRDNLTQFARTPLLLLLGAAAMVLVIACVNVANLLLVHATARRRDLAVRTSLGASRGRIARQLLTETAVLALAGGVAGTLVARLALPALVAMAPRNLPRLDEASVDLPVLSFALGLSLLVALAAGLAPALGGTAGHLAAALKEGGHRATEGRPRVWGRLALVAAQTALALVLLSGAGLMLGTLWRLSRVELGFDPTNVVNLQVALPRTTYASPAGKGTHPPTERFTLWAVRPEQTMFVERVLEGLRALPAVEGAAAVNYAPATGQNWGFGFTIEGQPVPDPAQRPGAMVKYVLPGYFRMIRVPMLRGRDFTDDDRRGAPDVVIVNEALVRAHLATTDPLAARLRLSDGVEDRERTFLVVGVVGTEKQAGLDAEPEPMLYIPYRQQAEAYVDWQIGFRMRVSFLVRTRGSPLAIASDLRQAVWAVDPNQPITRLETLESHIAESLAPRRLYAILLGAFALFGAGLAALGIYGVTTYAVTRRTHEIGVRMALGALPTSVVRLMLVKTLAAAGTGAGLGLAGAFGLTRLIRSQLYGVQPTDPTTLTAVMALMVLIALAAAFVPARRAARVDPMVALRSE